MWFTAHHEVGRPPLGIPVGEKFSRPSLQRQHQMGVNDTVVAGTGGRFVDQLYRERGLGPFTRYGSYPVSELTVEPL